MNEAAGSVRDGACLANGDLMEEGEAKEACGAGGCAGGRRREGPG